VSAQSFYFKRSIQSYILS